MSALCWGRRKWKALGRSEEWWCQTWLVRGQRRLNHSLGRLSSCKIDDVSKEGKMKGVVQRQGERTKRPGNMGSPRSERRPEGLRDLAAHALPEMKWRAFSASQTRCAN